MSNVYFISDLHLGHKNICKWAGPQRGNCKTTAEHNQWIVDQWNSVVTKRDTVFVLGDVAFDMEYIKLLDEMKGTKKLVRGNHDKFNIQVYLKYFDEVYGLLKYKGYWLSHAPIHPMELRGLKNIHGHVHNNSIPDDNYINVCVEKLNGIPRNFKNIELST